ncbi:15-hydroxyprostaglandin dehydrogenase [nad(+)] [Holotrichia oblita]|uniref:15-hydroxyprostaglandin dehydrogenase [nad(+)] n=1 Tax=Holotrichia oblita TaxID=644536 RepID=A0ACB9SP60_HOLOL|nr:15-hydroxyprostaglandin dehydrogenase [nad(+)] [Holotrichia oblita]
MHRFPKPFGQIPQNSQYNFIRRWYAKSKPIAQCGNTNSKKILRDKVAIVTGGASGIGCEFVRECLRRGATGVTIADINHCDGQRTAELLSEEFGKGRCMFVKCDVTKNELFDLVFKQTVKRYGQVDLLINNAAMLNDRKWERTIATNIGGCILGSLLAIQYMSRACIGKGGTVINVASVYGITPLSGLPIYSLSSAGIISLSKALGRGSQYDRTGVKIIALCLGPTCTPMLDIAPERTMNDKFKTELLEELEDVEKQPPIKVAKGLTKILKRAETGSVWVACNGYPPFEIDIPEDIDALKKNG